VVTLEELSKGIDNKRTPELDGEFDFNKLCLSEYDIRTERDVSIMIETLKRDGQLEPLTISLDDESAIIVNGRTRYYGFAKMKQFGEWAPNLPLGKVKVKVYRNLTVIEQNYLNATINSNQKTLTTDEKLAFVEQHENELDEDSLRKALGLESKKHVKDYKSIAKVLRNQPELRDYLKTTKGGRGRGDIEIETARVIASVSDEVGRLALAKRAEKLKTEREITDRARRKELTKKAKKYEDLNKHRDELGLSQDELADVVIERSNDSLFSLFSASKGSEGKYGAFSDWVNDDWGEVIIFNPTTPYLNGSPTKESEAAIALRVARLRKFKVTLVEKDLPIANIWKRFCQDHPTAHVINTTAEEFMVNHLTKSLEKTLFYFNFKGDRAAREFMRPTITLHTLKLERPNSCVGHIIVEEWASPTNLASNYLELLSWFGKRSAGIKTIEEFVSRLASDLDMSWEIKWSKTLEEGNKRRTALVVFE